MLSAGSACLLAPRAGFDPVVDASISGTDELDEDEILDGLVNHPPQGIVFRAPAGFNEAALSTDLQRIERFYHARGFFEAKASLERVEHTEKGATVFFRVREGPAAEVSESEVEGADAFSSRIETQLEKDAESLVGERFDHKEFEKVSSRHESRMRNRGYYDAESKAAAEVDRSEGAVRVRYKLTPGLRKKLRRPTIKGDFVPRDSIEARIAWTDGARYTPRKIRTTEGRLLELDLVSAVDFDISSNPETHELDVEIDLREAVLNELRWSVGVRVDSSNTVARTRLSYLRRNFFHPLRSFRADVRPEYFLEAQSPGFSGSVFIIRDDPFAWSRVQVTYGIDYGLAQFPAFSILSLSGSATFEKPFLEDRLTLRLRPAIDTFSTSTSFDRFENYADTVEVDLGSDQVGAFETSLRYDQRDDPLSPTRGYFAGVGATLGASIHGDRNPFALSTAELKGYVPLGTTRIIGAARVEYTTQLASGPVPLPRRIFGGGSGSHRGFSRRELSPGVVASDGTYLPIGGEAEYLSSIELRFNIFRAFDQWVGFVAFVDAGDVTLSPSELDATTPHVAPGVGFRMGTPIGPLRLDFGYRVNRTAPPNPAPGDPFNFHLALGEAF